MFRHPEDLAAVPCGDLSHCRRSGLQQNFHLLRQKNQWSSRYVLDKERTAKWFLLWQQLIREEKVTAVSLVGVDRAAVIVDAARRKSDSCGSRKSSCDLQMLRDERVTAVRVDREAVTADAVRRKERQLWDQLLRKKMEFESRRNKILGSAATRREGQNFRKSPQRWQWQWD